MHTISNPPFRSLPEVVCNIMMLCRGIAENGVPFWAYMCMLPNQAEMFYHDRKRGALNLDDYGTVLESGEGEQPPEAIKKRMREQFGMREDFEDALLKLIEQLGGKT